MKKIKTAIFPVGGLGTRFLPATKVMPKEMLPVLDKPLIQYAFEEAKAAGAEKFIFITGRNKNVIENHFDHAYELQKVLEEKEKNEILSLTKDWVPSPGSIAFIRQQQTLGLGHAVLCAKNYVNEPFAVLLADELFYCKQPAIEQMMEVSIKENANTIAVRKIPQEKVGSYGVIKPAQGADTNEKAVRVESLVEKPKPEVAPSNMAVVGRYILHPEIFSYLEKQEAGHGGEIQLTDAINKMTIDGNFKTFGVQVEGERFDCGSRRGFLEANMALALHNQDMRADVLKAMKGLIAKFEG